VSIRLIYYKGASELANQRAWPHKDLNLQGIREFIILHIKYIFKYHLVADISSSSIGEVFALTSTRLSFSYGSTILIRLASTRADNVEGGRIA
jgi:hypothetical protein